VRAQLQPLPGCDTAAGAMTALTDIDLAPPPAAARGAVRAVRWTRALRDVRDASSLWRLCWTLAWLDIKLRYRGSMLGPFWLTISTGVMVGAMGVVYSALFHMNLRQYLPFLALSLVLWGFVGTLVSDACTGYTQSEGMIRSIRIPYSLYAARIVVRNLLILAHNLVVIVLVYMVLRVVPGWVSLLAVPGFLLWLVVGFAVTAMLGAVCARFRDIPPIVASVIQMAFFVTPVIWKPEQVGPSRQALLAVNPFYALLDMVRAPLLGHAPSLLLVGSALGWSVVACALSWIMFVRVRGRIAFWV
jgi:lipopolysaccharide transport system permease protein